MQPNGNSRVVVTGFGLITPIGTGVDAFWDSLKNGRGGVRRITQFDPSSLTSQIAGEVPDFDPGVYLNRKDARRMSRASQFAVGAAQLAVQDAGLTIDESNREDVGVLIASGASSPLESESMVRDFDRGGYGKINPFHVTGSLPNMPSCQVAIHYGLLGYTSSVCTACAAGSQAIGESAEVIRRGEASVMLAGGTEGPIAITCVAGFCSLRAVSTRNDDPLRASRPFDAGRDGFILSEGSGVVVLESLTHAQRRGARIYAELIGYASTCDAYHVTAPEPHGRGAARAMKRALQRAGVEPDKIDYINAHATSTEVGDAAETLAVKTVFGERAYSVPVSSTKSMTGHMTTAAGAVEAAAAILAMRHSLIPPTINYETPDPVCDLDYVPNQARPAELEMVMSNSFGFGGINSVLIFRRPDGIAEAG
ncbi:MAG TPA: beta-ketoacyl-ACP synthase II [Anaerolineales bacterium]|nr:beta-ketoacyl-ACP synthase II [Anaerolineales bacterium]